MKKIQTQICYQSEDGSWHPIDATALRRWVERREKLLARAKETDTQKAARTEKDKDINEGLMVWDRELAKRGFAVPARNFGRDRKIFGTLVRAYGIPEVAECMRAWLDYRAREKQDATIIGFMAAFERVYQRRHGR